jgi:hypothetical protein
MDMSGQAVMNITAAEGIFHFGMKFVEKYDTLIKYTHFENGTMIGQVTFQT